MITNPPINFFKVRGAHETLVGNTQVNGHDGDAGYDSDLTPVSDTLIMAATEMLGSSDWGHVRFRKKRWGGRVPRRPGP